MIPKSENFPQQVKDVQRQQAFFRETLAYAPRKSFATVNRWKNGQMVSSELALRQLEWVCKLKQSKGC